MDVGKSVSRVGGKAQIPAYRRVAGDLRLSYTQFQELESFARFGTRLDERTKLTLEHGRRVREVLKQRQLAPMSAGEQIVVLLAVAEGLMDQVPVGWMGAAETAILEKVLSEISDLQHAVSAAGKEDPLWSKLISLIKEALSPFMENDANTGIAKPKDQDRP